MPSSMEDNFKRTRNIKLSKDLRKINTSNFNTMKLIEGVDPKYAKHMFLRNELIENFAKHMGGGIDILDQPVCEHCERPAAWNDGETAYCFSCNKITKEPITVHKYLIKYTKGLSNEQLEILTMLGGIEDETT